MQFDLKNSFVSKVAYNLCEIIADTIKKSNSFCTFPAFYIVTYYGTVKAVIFEMIIRVLS